MSPGWQEFSIGPPAGRSASVQAAGIRADGITLLATIAIAYDTPSVRVLGPSWLAETRYSLTAVVAPDRFDSFRLLLQRELDNRLQLDTHVERRSFETFVLSAPGAPQLEPSSTPESGTWIGDDKARLRGADMRSLAAALQSILGRPVVDETGIRGWYDLEFEWTADRVASVAALLHDRYGLRLSPGRREMNALVVDHVRRDAALVLLSHVGRAAQRTPPAFRRHLATLLTVR